MSPAPAVIIPEQTFVDEKNIPIIVIDYADDVKTENEKAPLIVSPSTASCASKDAPALISMPGQNTIITRMRYTLIFLNLFIPVFLEATGLIGTRPYMSIMALFFALCGAHQLNRQIKQSKRDLAEVQAGFAEWTDIEAKNKNVMRQLRLEIVSAWIGAASWLLATLMWATVLVVSTKVKETHVTIVVSSAVETVLCLVLGVAMTRYRKLAVEEAIHISARESGEQKIVA